MDTKVLFVSTYLQTHVQSELANITAYGLVIFFEDRSITIYPANAESCQLQSGLVGVVWFGGGIV